MTIGTLKKRAFSWVQKPMFFLLLISILGSQAHLAAKIQSNCDLARFYTAALALKSPCQCGHCDAMGPDADCDMDAMEMDAVESDGPEDAVSLGQGFAYSGALADSSAFQPGLSLFSLEHASLDGSTVGIRQDSDRDSDRQCDCSLGSQSESPVSALTAQFEPVPIEAIGNSSVGQTHLALGLSHEKQGAPPPSRVEMPLYVINSSMII